MTNSVIPLPTGGQPAGPLTAPAAPVESVPTPASAAARVEPAQALSPVITVATTTMPAAPWQPPILGSLATIFGVASLLTGAATLVLAPLALALAAAAVIFRQVSWAVIGGAAAIVALATSEYFWGLLGLAWLINRLSGLWH